MASGFALSSPVFCGSEPFSCIIVRPLQRRGAPRCGMPWPGTGWLHAAVSHIRTYKSQVLDQSRSITHAADPDITRDCRNRHLDQIAPDRRWNETEVKRGQIVHRVAEPDGSSLSASTKPAVGQKLHEAEGHKGIRSRLMMGCKIEFSTILHRKAGSCTTWACDRNTRGPR